jgi:hypothetical protein
MLIGGENQPGIEALLGFAIHAKGGASSSRQVPGHVLGRTTILLLVVVGAQPNALMGLGDDVVVMQEASLFEMLRPFGTTSLIPLLRRVVPPPGGYARMSRVVVVVVAVLRVVRLTVAILSLA